LYSKIVILNFPPEVAQQALVCKLTKKYDLLFNILSAKISNQKYGFMVLELLSSSKSGFNKGVKYLKKKGVSVSFPEHQIFKDEEICTHCGACTAVCPTEALHIIRPEMELIFMNSSARCFMPFTGWCPKKNFICLILFMKTKFIC